MISRLVNLKHEILNNFTVTSVITYNFKLGLRVSANKSIVKNGVIQVSPLYHSS